VYAEHAAVRYWAWLLEFRMMNAQRVTLWQNVQNHPTGVGVAERSERAKLFPFGCIFLFWRNEVRTNVALTGQCFQAGFGMYIPDVLWVPYFQYAKRGHCWRQNFSSLPLSVTGSPPS